MFCRGGLERVVTCSSWPGTPSQFQLARHALAARSVADRLQQLLAARRRLSSSWCFNESHKMYFFSLAFAPATALRPCQYAYLK